MWDLIVSVPDHCLSFYFTLLNEFLNGRELRIENSVTTVTVQHLEVILSDGNFHLHQTTIMGSFSCILFIRRLHLGLNMYSCINFMHSRNNNNFQ